MFNKSFKARFGGADVRVRKQRNNNEGEKTIKLTLHYQFDQKIASEIGGDAVPLQKMLAKSNGKDDHATLTGSGLKLGTRNVDVRFRLGNEHHVIGHDKVIGLSAKAVPPDSKGTDPTLDVQLTFKADEEDLSMVWDRMDSVVGTRMDRQQLELPETGGE